MLFREGCTTFPMVQLAQPGGGACVGCPTEMGANGAYESAGVGHVNGPGGALVQPKMPT
jgi:hypothetical protein